MRTSTKIYLTFLILSLPLRLICQVNVWTNPDPLTDSLTDNRNAIVDELSFFAGSDFYVLWEKSENTDSTHIYARRYYSDDEPQALVTGGYHYTDPCILNVENVTYPMDTSFYLFYLSDQGGNLDIYYKIYTSDGFTEPVAFTSTPGDEKHLSSNGTCGLTWECDGAIKYTRLRKTNYGPFYFTDIITVDSGAYKNPVLEAIPDFSYGEGFLAWEKIVNDSSKIMLSGWDYSGDKWDVPVMVYDTGHNTNLRFEESSFSEVWPTMTWERTENTGGRKIICYDPLNEDYLFLEMDQQAQCFPSVFNIFVGVSDVWFYALMSFIKEENGQTDVYGGYTDTWQGNYENLSRSTAVETNPHLWNGTFFGDYEDVINVWESSRDGRWQLYTSKILVPIFGGVNEENQNTRGILSVSPNPFSGQVTVTFKSQERGKGILSIYDYLGRKAGTILETDIITGEQSWVIDPERQAGCDLKAGIYFLRLEVNGMNFTAKVIKSAE